MITISFKLSEDEASSLRMRARRAKMTVSSFLRQKVRAKESMPLRITHRRCPITGATIFSRKGENFSPITTEKVREILTEFP